MEAFSRTLAFSQIVRDVVTVARRHGLEAPVFRSPPPAGMDRSLRRRPSGVVVSVRVRDRNLADVADDVVAGVLAANRDVDVPDEVTVELHTAAHAAVPSAADA